MESKYFSDFKMAIESVVAYAKATGFNPDTDNFDTLMNGWINQSKKQHEEIMDRAPEAIQIIKSILG